MQNDTQNHALERERSAKSPGWKRYLSNNT
jgi:hypothetical protein